MAGSGRPSSMQVAPSSMAAATCLEEGPLAIGWVDPVEVTRVTPQTLHPMWPQTHRMADVEELMTKFGVSKVVDGAGPQAKATPV